MDGKLKSKIKENETSADRLSKICIAGNYPVDEDLKKAIEIGMKSSNNYASCYAIPISTPVSVKLKERKGHNGAHPSHFFSN